MTKRTTSIAALLFMLLAGLSLAPAAQAQQLRVGYTDSERILVNMPEYQNVQQQLEQEAQNRQQQLQAQMQQFQQDVQNFQEEQSMLSAERRQEREQELMQRQQQLQQQQQQQQQQLMQQEQELMNPVITRLQGAIDEVAAQRDLDLVLESRAMLFVDDSSANLLDITPDVADNLGLEPPEETTEGVDIPASSN